MTDDPNRKSSQQSGQSGQSGQPGQSAHREDEQSGQQKKGTDDMTQKRPTQGGQDDEADDQASHGQGGQRRAS